ncbi:MAG: hypothetical protein LBO08_03605 [Rickettsiales bacterium]|jgi:hypothetical protein|nr:hypothetical protein [Rickettsiales bacterium]
MKYKILNAGASFAVMNTDTQEIIHDGKIMRNPMVYYAGAFANAEVPIEIGDLKITPRLGVYADGASVLDEEKYEASFDGRLTVLQKVRDMGFDRNYFVFAGLLGRDAAIGGGLETTVPEDGLALRAEYAMLHRAHQVKFSISMEF